MDRYATWILDQIKEHAPEGGGGGGNAYPLAEAAAALKIGGGQIFGMVMPQTLGDAREALLAEAVATLERWIPKLVPDQLALVASVVQRADLPIDLSDRLEEVQAAAKEQKARRRSAAKTSEPYSAELERAVIDNPDDRDAHAVLADFLE